MTNKNVSSNQSVTLGTIALTDTGATGDTANYSLNSAKLNIVQRPISTVYLTKLYDASTTVQASDLQTMSNLVGSETLTLTGNVNYFRCKCWYKNSKYWRIYIK